MTTPSIKELLAREVDRNIEEVIKVDQDDAAIIRGELEEYVITNSILGHYIDILERYDQTPANPHEGIGVWVSGFFGSGKSSFAKNLGLALANRDILGTPAASIFASRRSDSAKLQVLLKQITERIPTDAVIFDVSTDRGIKTANQSMTEIMHRCFVRYLGYAGHIDIAQLEIDLESEGRLDEFKARFLSVFEKQWDTEKAKVSFALNQASRVMHELEPATYSAADSWVKGAQHRADITPRALAERCKELMNRRRPGHTLVFVIDEVGQFVARDVQKMLDLQGLVQSLGVAGRGKIWLVVTSQEKLTELVGGLDDRRVELARLMDRFPLQVHLEPSDISEVTSRRVLSKNAAGEQTLRKLFEAHRGKLSQSTTISADIRLAQLTAESFITLYPLLPYQIDLIISIVSGLRTQGGATHHVGGANRTIIKLAQQLLIHPDIALGDCEVGKLVRIDQIYDLVSGNIPSELRGKISDIGRQVDHPYAAPVAKAICLLQFVKNIHRTAENVAACLHPAVDADSCLTEVKGALEKLENAKFVRLGDDGYRIPSPAEDDWERQRDGFQPRPADTNEILRETVLKLWSPQPAHQFLDTKLFKAALFLNNRPVVQDGDIPFYMALCVSEAEFKAESAEMRTRSQTETKHIFWAAQLAEKVDHNLVEYFRSKQIIAAKERSARTRDEMALVSDEKKRQGRHSDELRRLIRESLLAGNIWFRGNDRSPGDNATDVAAVAEATLGVALPEVFDRYEDGAAHVTKQDLDSILSASNLHGLSPVYAKLDLLRDEGGQTILKTDSGALAEVQARIENRASYGESATGRYLTEEFAREPYGWDFDVVRLFVACLLRAGKIDATSQGKVIETAVSVEARNLFGNNNTFKSATFRPKVAIDFAKLVEANECYKDVFGHELPDIASQGAVAAEIRKACLGPEEEVSATHTLLVSHRLPGASVMLAATELLKSIRTGTEEQAILSFNADYKQLKEARKRVADLRDILTDPALLALRNASEVLSSKWPVLENEPDLDSAFPDHVAKLKDLLAKETFYKELAAISQYAAALKAEYARRHSEASAKRSAVYTDALAKVATVPEWDDLEMAQQDKLVAPLKACAAPASADTGIALMRSDIDACTGRAQKVIEEMLRLIDGARLVRLDVGKFFAGGIETAEQLESAITALREECERQLAEGKRILIQ
jgi:hypothetical protein